MEWAGAAPPAPGSDKPAKSAPGEPFAGHDGEVTCVAFYDGGKKIVSGGADKTLPRLGSRQRQTGE